MTSYATTNRSSITSHQTQMARMDGDFSASDDETETVKVDEKPYQGKKTVAFKK